MLSLNQAHALGDAFATEYRAIGADPGIALRRLFDTGAGMGFDPVDVSESIDHHIVRGEN